MRRREFIVLIGSAAVGWPVAAMAQEAGRTYRVGMLLPFPRDVPFMLRFLDEMHHHGFVEGQNLALEYIDFESNVDLIPEYAAKLVNAQVNVLVGGGGVPTRALQQATKAIPILGVADDLVAEGLVDSLARPNANTTGVSILATELNGKRQEILIEVVPGLRRMGALADRNTTTDAKLHALQEAALARSIELSVYQVAKGEEIAASIDKAQVSGITALNVLASPMLYGNRQLIMDRVAALRLPAMYQWPEMAQEGGFIAYGPRLTQLPELEARQLAKLLRGTKPSDLPVEQPTKFELVINLKTAKALGLRVPESFLVRADEVIE